ncbi:unnamed protein product [Choristocarpus tenellus]|uniref:ribosomal protein S4 n=1 Tax=Choristocarpus tenellus TaxID=116065 RepID=UPI002E764048|nr:ribosomal protein S4 [Choristocarpus tenellus]WBP69801.1 ribosomal protein S4 [Choristocarpus tenellus]
MRLKPKYKSCIWTKTDIWGDLLNKRKFLRLKWVKTFRILKGQKRRRRRRLYKDYNFIKTRNRSNIIFKYRKWAFRNYIISNFCIKRFYGDLKDKSFRLLCKKIWKYPSPYYSLIQSLESRLDTTLFRLGLFPTISASSQSIKHGIVSVNHCKITSSSYRVKPGDLIEIIPNYRKIVKYKIGLLYSKRFPRWKISNTLSWVETDYPSISFLILDIVNPKEVFYPFRLNLDDILWSSRFYF